MFGILAAIFAYFMFALGNIFEKIMRSSHVKSPFTLIVLDGIAHLPFLLIPLFHTVITTNYLNMALPALAGAFSIAGFLPYLIALKKEDQCIILSH